MVFTSQPVTRYFASARATSSGLRGSPGWWATPAFGGVEPPWASSSPGTFSGASQNASHLMSSITCEVISTPRSRSGLICWSVARR